MDTDLSRELDKVKSKLFFGSNASILGSLMCSCNFIWDDTVKTAATDGENIWWNPKWFKEIPPETRKTVLAHELWHIAKLHMLRFGTKNKKVWGEACDYSINNALVADGYTFEGVKPLIDPMFIDWAEEDIYDYLMQQMPPSSPHCNDDDEADDLIEPSKEIKSNIVNNVVQASHQAKIAKSAGNLAGQVETVLGKYLKPIVPWQSLLYHFFTDLGNFDYSWARPNRRYQDMYLPSVKQDESVLLSLNYYFDVSGSVSDEDIKRFNSEVAYIKEAFCPKKLTVVQFDTCIRKIDVFTEDDPYDKLKVIGRGGTSLIPVHEHIQETLPNAAIIFSDLYCPPMEAVPVPVVWVVIGNRNAKVNFGKVIHI